MTDSPSLPAVDGGLNGLAHKPQARAGLVLGSLGVVFGDIGTSPLYAFREAVAASGEGAAGASPAVVLGVLSLIFWALILVVSLKYVLLLLAADNNGEGGTLSLMALAQHGLGRPSFGIVLLGMVGAALFFGDATITPAISVLSAVEGLEVAAPRLSPFVLPLTILILFGLFVLQRGGTGRVSAFFGPITALWFIVLGVVGLMNISAAPGVLASLSPVYGIAFLYDHGFLGFFILGAVFLAVTGAEAMYADLGHFGRAPIRIGWFGLVFPALMLNYLGQGALVLSDPEALENPFFLLFPEWAAFPAVILATAATVIASQAVISGAYSLARQAIQLGLLPRMRIRITSETQTGQIYIPRINWLLFATVVLLTLLFGSSENLAAAYGISVSASMAVDGLLAFVVLRHCWKWSLLKSAAVIAPFVIIDFAFLSANTLKIAAGGWVPILLGGTLLTLMITWRRGARLLFEKTRRQEVPLADLVRQIEAKPPARVAGTAVFLTGDPQGAPTALLHNLKHNKVLHERNIILTIRTEQTPRVSSDQRVEIETLSPSFQRVTMSFGFMETPNLLRGLAICKKKGIPLDIMSTSIFMSRRNLKRAMRSGMPAWQDHIFIWLAGSANSATDYFQIPADRVVEIGAQVTI